MYILFDIGGTKTRIAGSPDLKSFTDPVIFETPEKYSDGIAKIKEVVQEISGGKKIKKIAGGIAGPVGRRKSSLIKAPNLSDWVYKPLQSDLEDCFKAKVLIENDAAMAGLGEANFGAGKGFRIVVYITVSTGCGGARIVNGEIDEYAIGFEPGHQIIDADYTYFSDADGIYLNDIISGNGILKRTGKRPEEIEDETFWEKVTEALVYGLNNTIVHWSPDVLVLGGSIINFNKIEIQNIEGKLKRLIKIYPELPLIKKGELVDSAGLYGAMAYLRG